ncbi:SMP-30/gluconolactonase/LRE family protein [Jannaschia ovalis]|uniref:SMP-30/gluconolactonase/LRE family protein n=1 Tax=Jannaschia ovalis TaxID=3038773 RepID=A0ABY8L795_9RHOB|nr:SMP-30/gluconolactonase/LRE family protein [Jannaschia sp. GRR-S6-38]WGH77166.1 SMP-30/gluconolactonase/LRE family protein [Jannaschia sp. GRR-S6-38]
MLDRVSYVGHGLTRPECVLATASGDLFCAHGDRGVARIRPDGTQMALAAPTEFGGHPVLANGIALRGDGSFLVANIADGGGLMELDAEGFRPFHACSTTATPPPVNFVLPDETGRIWITVSSTMTPRSLAYRPDVANGYVGVIERGRFRVVLEGLGYTNEIRADYAGGWLYIAETMAQRVSRVRLDEAGLHGAPEVFARMPAGAFPDGLALDAEGGLLVACIVSNELFRIDPEGGLVLVVGERDAAWAEEVQAAFAEGTMGRPHLDRAPTRILRNIASVTHAGPGLDRLVCGVLLDDRLPVLPAPVPGIRPLHWEVEVPDWGAPF